MYRLILRYEMQYQSWYVLTFCKRISLENYQQDDTVIFYEYDLTSWEIGQILGGN